MHNELQFYIFRAKLILIHKTNKDFSRKGQEETREVVTNSPGSSYEFMDCSPNLLLLKSQVCYGIQIPHKPIDEPNLRILSHGPMMYSLIYQKTDPTMKGYKFRYKWVHNEDVSPKQINFIIEMRNLLFILATANYTFVQYSGSFVVNSRTRIRLVH